VAALDSGTERKLPDLMAAADAALYRAKSCGRDQVQMISTTRGLSAVSSASGGINGTVDGQAQNGQAQNGQAQNGQAQNGQAQNGQARDGQAQNGQARDGLPRDGQVPAAPGMFRRALTS